MKEKQQALKEFKLRRLIRKAIRIKEAKERKAQAQIRKEEEKLRQVVRHLILKEEVDSDTNPAPYESTAMNILADVLDQALPVVKSGLRKLAKPEERASYRAHVIEKFMNLFNTIESLDVAGKAIGESDLELAEQEQDNIEIKIDSDMVIPPSEKDRFKPKEKKPEEAEQEKFSKFAIAGENPTGARAAFDTFNNSNISSIVANKRKVLHDEADKQEFKDYALYNIDLWLTTYEDEISDELGQEPAFTKPITQKPSGAKVDAPKVPNDESEPAPEGGGAGSDFEAELEKVLMMEDIYVGE